MLNYSTLGSYCKISETIIIITFDREIIILISNFHRLIIVLIKHTQWKINYY